MLCKWGNFDLTPYIEAGGYDPTPNRRNDLDSYQDAVEGKLHRTTLQHTRSTISIKIVPMFENTHKAFMNSITSNYINAKERDANIEYYDTEYCKMSTGHFYIDSNQKFGAVDREYKGQQKRMTGFTLELVEY